MRIKSKIIRYIKPKFYSSDLSFPGYYFCELLLTNVTKNIEEIKINLVGSTLEEIEHECVKFINKFE